MGVIHADITVDRWKKVTKTMLNGQQVTIPVWTGRESYSFGVDDMKTKKHFAKQTSWLGWTDMMAVPPFVGLPEGDYLEGRIYHSSYDPRVVWARLHTTPGEDIQWYEYMETKRFNTRDRYTPLWQNCVNYCNHEFGDAKRRFGF